MLKAAILSISLLTIMASAAISPALGIIAAAFPHADAMLIRLIVTLPSMTIIPASLMSARLTRVMKKRTILFIGLVLYMAGGVGGGLVSSMDLILVMRGILGIGVGLLMPVSTALVSDFFKGDEAAKMTGWVTASNNLGGIIAVILSGWLASFCWRYSFFVYFLALVAAVFVVFFLPEPERQALRQKTDDKLPPVTYLAAGAAFAMMTVFYVLPTNIALFIKESGLGNAKTAGLALALVTGFAFVSGSLFSKTQGHLRHLMATVQMSLMAAGFFLLSGNPSLPLVFLAVSLIGASFGNLYPMILLLVVHGVPRAQNTKAMAVVSIFLFSGQFFSPLFFGALEHLAPNPGIPVIFVTAAGLSGGAALLFLVKAFRDTRSAVAGDRPQHP
ncbi:MFS transporter [Desulfoluna spongiiphila]|uniref:MFS transporter n=1 Tax=Desulfoluna spongiiphila TaxID=419481 RepID=UPI001253FBDC|nr:MFS transporter [Desulfoluna spongiiphila]VVS94536.1 mfs transporter superfamily [Desulfoluna spongiiphila]